MRRAALLAALALLGLPAAAAQAAIPGENGPIAYVTSRMGPPIPMVIDPDGGTPRAVGRPGQVGPAWSPDGSALAVAGAVSGGPRAATTFEIFTMPLGG